jgi:hypothetical protein
MRRLFLASLAAATVGAAAQSNLQMVAQSGDGNITYLLRTDRVTKGAFPGNYTIWVFGYSRRVEQLQFVGRPKVPYTSSATQYAIFCKDGSYGIGQSSYYDASGNTVITLPGNIGNATQPVPDTVGDGIVRSSCQYLGTPVQ